MTHPALFDEIERNDESRARRTESLWPFLNRSGRQSAAEIRATYTTWFDRYPLDGAHEFSKRFRTANALSFQAASFELVLHQLFTSLGCDIRIHPELLESPSRPDFELRHDSGLTVVEATVVDSDRSLKPKALESELQDAIDEVPSAYFWLRPVLHGTVSNNPGWKRIQREIKMFVDSYDVDEVQATMDRLGPEGTPGHNIRGDGWELRLQLWPKPSSQRGNISGRTLGMDLIQGGFVADDYRVRRALLSKAQKYGKLDCPMVLAVNFLDHLDEIDISNILFGSERFLVDPNDLAAQPTFERAPDGLWMGRNYRPRYTRISGVLIAQNLGPWNLESPSLRLYINPWASHPLPDLFGVLPTVEVANGIFDYRGGESIAKLLTSVG